jgi:hypothetical protein
MQTCHAALTACAQLKGFDNKESLDRFLKSVLGTARHSTTAGSSQHHGGPTSDVRPDSRSLHLPVSAA